MKELKMKELKNEEMDKCFIINITDLIAELANYRIATLIVSLFNYQFSLRNL